MKNMVTIKDIARESGYSISTVSRVLNHRNDVSPDAKKKIEEVVEKFHFVPNNNAKHLKQSNTKTIVVLVKGISNMLFSNIVEEIQQMIGRTDYTLVVSYIDEDENEVEQALQLCRERKPLGLLFLGGNPEFFKQGFAKVDVPSAISDVMAIGAIRALRDMDYRVPEDISVIGFDGTVLAEYYNPKLATIRQQYQTLAVRSVEILFGQIELKKEPIYEVVPFEFASGESIKNLK